MRYTSIMTLAAALMMGGASAAYAQGGQQQFGQGSGAQQFGQGPGGFGGQQFGQGAGGNRFQERAALRRQLRQVGFQNIRILDAAYLVQASTPDGRTFVMIVDPAGGIAGARQMGQPGQRFGGQQQFDRQGGQMGQTGQQNRRSGMGQAQGTQDMSGSGGQQGGRMTESEVRSLLEERGLSNIQNLEREGNTFTASADWQGEQIDVSVNATTGEITQPDEL